MTLDYEKELEGLFRSLGEALHMVLATAEGDRVTARTVSCIIHDGAVYFQTDSAMTKHRQLSRNPRVALCKDNIQMEGRAETVGKPLEEANRFFAAAFQAHFLSSFDAYSGLDNEVLVKVVPERAALWEYPGGEPHRRYIDCLEKRAWLERYEG